MAETKVAKREGEAVQTARVLETETTYVPDVDITENNEGIRVMADMPGVDAESVEVTVENDVLTIEGRARAETLDGCELVGQEYGVGKYRRDFTLSMSVDTAGIKARVRHGVLVVTIPKRDEARTKKIEIEA